MAIASETGVASWAAIPVGTANRTAAAPTAPRRFIAPRRESSLVSELSGAVTERKLSTPRPFAPASPRSARGSPVGLALESLMVLAQRDSTVFLCKVNIVTSGRRFEPCEYPSPHGL